MVGPGIKMVRLKLTRICEGLQQLQETGEFWTFFFVVFRMGYDKTASKVGASQRIQFRGISPTFLNARPY